jgi:hypothetical protein
MLTLEKENNTVLWEAESIIKSVVLTQEVITLQIEKFMQDEPFYGEPDYSYY